MTSTEITKAIYIVKSVELKGVLQDSYLTQSLNNFFQSGHIENSKDGLFLTEKFSKENEKLKNFFASKIEEHKILSNFPCVEYIDGLLVLNQLATIEKTETGFSYIEVDENEVETEYKTDSFEDALDMALQLEKIYANALLLRNLRGMDVKILDVSNGQRLKFKDPKNLFDFMDNNLHLSEPVECRVAFQKSDEIQSFIFKGDDCLEEMESFLIANKIYKK